MIFTSTFREWFTVNGEEPEYDPEKWESYADGNNCYAYAFDNHKERPGKPQPNNQAPHVFNCKSLHKWIKRDLIDKYGKDHSYKMVKLSKNTACPTGTHKIYLVHSGDDYHFYRLDSDGIWSHKPGANEVTRLDGSNQIIDDPSTADHDYDHYNYNTSCGFLCVPHIDEAF